MFRVCRPQTEGESKKQLLIEAFQKFVNIVRSDIEQCK